VDVNATGRGQVSVIFGAEFTPAEIIPDAVYRGISVKRIIQRVNPLDNRPTGPALTTGVIGQRVVVTIQITIPDYSASIEIIDSFPGAIEPQDDLIYGKSSSGNMKRQFRGGMNMGGFNRNRFISFDYWSWYFGGAFSMKQFLKDKVIFYGQNLYAGTHTVTYNAVITTEGEFVFPPALARDVRQPELMGLSSAGVFTTKTISDNSVSISIECLPFNTQLVPARATVGNDKTYTEQPSATPTMSTVTIVVIVVVAVAVVAVVVAVVLSKKLKKKIAKTVLVAGIKEGALVKHY